MTPGERILILAPLGRDGPLSQRVLEEAGLSARVCGSMGELCAEIAEGAAAVLLTEEVLVPEATRQLLAVLELQPAWSDLPLVVFGSADPRLGEKANVTLLDRPVRLRTLISTMRGALRARARQYQARDLLAAREQSVRDRDQFLAMLGHELRNPLAAILTASELIDRGAGSSFARERAVIGRQTRNLARLVDDLLEVARVTSGKIELKRTVFDLFDLLRRLVQSAEVTARRQGVKVVLRAPEHACPIAADALRIEQVVANVLTNAIKYTPADGQVEVEARVEGAEAMVRVRDTGVGISPEMLPQVFELFTQAPGSLDRSQGGMGIGLTLAQRLVRLHGGTISAASEGLGRGSLFEIRLPLGAQHALGAGVARPEVEGRPKRVLLVEDNEDSREVIGVALENLGHRVSACGDGWAAIERALRERPDAMIVDLGLPGKNGLDVAREVRAALGPGVRLVAMTGYGQPDDRARALAAGFDVFLAKPAELDDLSRALQADAGQG
ncbi:MAG: hypothetical protein NVS4B10_06600 [Myxococcales bacterium]